MKKLLLLLSIISIGQIQAQCPININTPTLCVGQFGDTLSVTGANTYSWSPYNNLSSTTGSTVTISYPGTTTIYTVVGTAGTCTSSITFTAYPTPLVNVTPQTTSGCVPICLTFQNTTFSTGTYYWNFGNGNTSSSASPTECYTVSNVYTATLTITATSGCSGSGMSTVVGYGIPSFSIPSYTNCAGTLDTLIPNCNNSYCYQYIWHPSPFFTSSVGDTVIVNPTTTTIYTIVASSNYGCRDSTTSTITINCADIQNISNNIKIAIYPNPTSDQFFIDANTADKLTVDLYDVNGRHVFSKSVSDKSNIKVALLDNGIYTLTIKTVDRLINKKLVIVH